MPSRSARFAAATKASRIRARPAASSCNGAASPALCGIADGATACQPPSETGICCPPSHGVWLEPLRPACASCIATAVLERLRTEARIGFSAASVASFHSPRHPGVMRPIASTWVASMQNIAAPDSARLLMCVKCQSLASPLSAEYWHIGATMMRLRSFSSRSLIGENRALMSGCPVRGRKGFGTFKVALVRLPAPGLALRSAPGLPLPLAGKVDALDRARRVGENSIQTSTFRYLAGTPTPTLPRKRERARSGASRNPQRRTTVHSTGAIIPPARIAATGCAGAAKSYHPKPWSARWRRRPLHGLYRLRAIGPEGRGPVGPRAGRERFPRDTADADAEARAPGKFPLQHQ